MGSGNCREKRQPSNVQSKQSNSIITVFRRTFWLFGSPNEMNMWKTENWRLFCLSWVYVCPPKSIFVNHRPCSPSTTKYYLLTISFSINTQIIHLLVAYLLNAQLMCLFIWEILIIGIASGGDAWYFRWSDISPPPLPARCLLAHIGFTAFDGSEKFEIVSLRPPPPPFTRREHLDSAGGCFVTVTQNH